MPVRFIKTILPDTFMGLWHMTEPWEELQTEAGLEGGELAQLFDLKKDKRKQEWLACRALIGKILGFPPLVRHDSDRKPFLENADYFLSMSHSGELACVYLNQQRPVGIDIQQMKPSISKGFDYFLNAAEQTWVDIDNNLLMHLIWSAKESAFKSAGNAELDLKKHFTTTPFKSNQKGAFEVCISNDAEPAAISVGFDTFDDYVLTWTT